MTAFVLKIVTPLMLERLNIIVLFNAALFCAALIS